MFIDKYLSWNFRVLQLSMKLSSAMVFFPNFDIKLLSRFVYRSIMPFVILASFVAVIFGV